MGRSASDLLIRLIFLLSVCVFKKQEDLEALVSRLLQVYPRSSAQKNMEISACEAATTSRIWRLSGWKESSVKDLLPIFGDSSVGYLSVFHASVGYLTCI